VEAVGRVVGRGVPLDRSDVDTDQIIPSVWLKRIERTGYAPGLFSAWRADPAFVLNDARYAGATILVTGPNFGCGSSREHAVWALEEHGFRAVVAASFADIFRSNALKSGLVPVTAPATTVRALIRALERDPSIEIVVDVEARRLTVPAAGVDVPFALEDHARMRLLEGLDDVDLAMRHADAIAAYEGTRPNWLPSIRPR